MGLGELCEKVIGEEGCQSCSDIAVAHVFFVASGVPPLEVGEGSEGAEFVSQGSGAVDDGLHLVGVDGGGEVEEGSSGIEVARIVEESNDAIGRRVAEGILGQCIGLGQSSAAIEGGRGRCRCVEPERWLRRPIRPRSSDERPCPLEGFEGYRGRRGKPTSQLSGAGLR